MTRRIVRTAVQLSALIVLTLFVVFFLDSQFRVLPTAIHVYLPQHHSGHVVTDIVVTKCSRVNLLTSCRKEGLDWHRIEKDLFLGTGWVSSAYVHVQRKKEEELLPEDKIILDISIGRLDPATGVKGESDERWESRSFGIWVKRTSKSTVTDSVRAVTGVDVLFGADAVDPRTGWQIKDSSILLGAGEGQHPRLTIRRGHHNDENKPVLRVGDHGKFKILQVADLHLSTGEGVCRDDVPAGYNGGKCEADPRTLEFIAKMLDEEKPDMVVLSGDQVNGDTAPDAQSAIFKYAELFIRRKIPYVTIFGNHDDEKTLNRMSQMALVETLPYSLSRAGPPNIDGVGNYYVEVLGRGHAKESALTIYLLDTHSYSSDEKHYPGYDWLKTSQIDWFKKTSNELKEPHKAYSHIHMDLAFIHIPLPEYGDKNNPRKGEWRESVTAPKFNTNFRDALAEAGVVMVSCGHDHANEYCALSHDQSNDSKLWMCYGGGSGFGGYGGYGGYQRRVRIFDIDMNEARINTYKIVEQGDGKRVDEQIIVEGGKVKMVD